MLTLKTVSFSTTVVGSPSTLDMTIIDAAAQQMTDRLRDGLALAINTNVVTQDMIDLKRDLIRLFTMLPVLGTIYFTFSTNTRAGSWLQIRVEGTPFGTNSKVGIMLYDPKPNGKVASRIEGSIDDQFSTELWGVRCREIAPLLDQVVRKKSLFEGIF